MAVMACYKRPKATSNWEVDKIFLRLQEEATPRILGKYSIFDLQYIEIEGFELGVMRGLWPAFIPSMLHLVTLHGDMAKTVISNWESIAALYIPK